MKRSLCRLLCTILILANAGMPALAAVSGMGHGHAGHDMHSAQSHIALGAVPTHQVHAHQAPGHADSTPPESVPAVASDDPVECADTSCLACSHCQGMLPTTGSSAPASALQALSPKTFHPGQQRAALYRPPTTS